MTVVKDYFSVNYFFSNRRCLFDHYNLYNIFIDNIIYYIIYKTTWSLYPLHAESRGTEV